jgi:hypothetical protein
MYVVQTVFIVLQTYHAMHIIINIVYVQYDIQVTDLQLSTPANKKQNTYIQNILSLMYAHSYDSIYIERNKFRTRIL